MTRPFSGGWLAIRVDANARIGAGHVMRSIALAEAWRRAAGEALLFTASPLPLVAASAERRGIGMRPFASPADAWRELLGWTRVHGDAWVALDGYEFGHAAQQSIRAAAAGVHLLVIDDCAAGAEFDCDILLNQNIGANALGYRVSAATRCCLGPSYALLRSEFIGGAPARRFDAPASRIVVTFGGADVHNQAARVANILATSAPPVDATIVAGYAHTIPSEVRTADGVRVRWQPPTDDMAGLLASADLAICAAGSTCWELAHLGVPALTLVVADNQIGLAADLHHAGTIRNLGWFDSISNGDLVSAIERFRADPARGEMSRRGRELVDGRGADRVVAAMLAAVDGTW